MRSLSIRLTRRSGRRDLSFLEPSSGSASRWRLTLLRQHLRAESGVPDRHGHATRPISIASLLHNHAVLARNHCQSGGSTAHKLAIISISQFGTLDSTSNVAVWTTGWAEGGSTGAATGTTCGVAAGSLSDPNFTSRTPRILYVSDCILRPSRLTGHISFALSFLNSASILSTIGVRQLLLFPARPAKCSANLLSQFTTARRPSGSARVNVAP